MTLKHVNSKLVKLRISRLTSMLILTSLQTILLSEIIIVFAMIAGIAPQEFSYLILLLLGVSFIRLNTLDSLKLFIFSIPFFVALPANALSDSMSIWRILIVVLFLKAGWEKMGWLYNSNLAGSKLYLEPQCTNSELLVQNKIVCKCIKVRSVTANQPEKELSHLGNHPYPSLVRRGLRGGLLKLKWALIIKKVKNGFNKVKKAGYHRLFLLTFLFFIIALLSLLFAQNIGVGIKKILFLANIFLLFPVVIYSVRKESDLTEIIRFIFYSSAIVVFIGYIQFLATFFVPLYDFWQFWAVNAIRALYGEGLSSLLIYSNTWFSYYKVLPPTLRMFSVMPDSHSFAMLTIISIPVILSLIFYYKGKYKEKKYLSAALILFFMAVFFSGSRGAWLGSIFALISALYLAYGLREPIINIKFPKPHFLKKRNSKLIIYSVILFFVLMPASFLVLGQNQEIQLFRQGLSLSDKEKSIIFERAMSIYDFSETSNKGRLQIWKETIISIGSHPFLGIGFGNFPLVLGEKLTASKKGSSAHNIYLNIAAETGIFGLAVFLFILAEILKISYNLFYKLKKKYLKIFAGSFFVYFSWVLGYGIFDVVMFNDKVLMFVVILIGVLYAMEKLDKEDGEGTIR